MSISDTVNHLVREQVRESELEQACEPRCQTVAWRDDHETKPPRESLANRMFRSRVVAELRAQQARLAAALDAFGEVEETDRLLQDRKAVSDYIRGERGWWSRTAADDDDSLDN